MIERKVFLAELVDSSFKKFIVKKFGSNWESTVGEEWCYEGGWTDAMDNDHCGWRTLTLEFQEKLSIAEEEIVALKERIRVLEIVK